MYVMVDEQQRMRIIRSITGLERREFADRLGVHRMSVYNWEMGKTVPNNIARKALAEVMQEYGISIRSDGYPMLEVR
jgi:DNA-binding transcriptional regulator YiaG